MRPVLPVVTALALASTLALAGTAQAQQTGPASKASLGPVAYFEFADAGSDTFVFKLTDTSKIRHARDLLSGLSTDRRSVIGKIVTGTESYNPSWSYHYDPATVDFFDVATEVCDASIGYVEEHLSEVGGAFLPGNTWCPWSSHLVREVTVP
ncbi:calmodulin-binding protein [Streptosporangium sp. NPDC000239]|uniref:Calmodulin-binding protein n=1 Tax=Streptosporangium jomthongense TaxID=1193683 RepID=A0ABV8ERP0_9ACTN